MNEQEDLLQERLEQLEAGVPLADLLVDLPAAEAELLQLAATLRQVEAPLPNAARMAAGRADVLTLAARERKTAVSGGFWPTLRDWLLGQPRTALAGMAALVVLLLAVVLWPRGGQEMVEDAAVSPSAPLADSKAPQSPLVEATVVPLAEAEPALVTNLYSHFIPIMHVPFMTEVSQVGLVNPVGLVEVQQADGSWTAVTKQSVLNSGQVVRTGTFSSAGLLFYDGSQATLGPNSEIILDTVDAHKPEDGFRTVILTQLRGESVHSVQFRNDSGSRYEVKTLTASGIARGTQFRVSLAADGQTTYAVTEGRVDVSSAGRTVPIRAGQLTSFAQEAPPADPTFLVSGEGVVNAITPTAWTIAGQTFSTDANTVITGNPQVGDYVRVEGYMLANNTPYATHITLLFTSPLNRFSLTGKVTEIGGTAWVVAGQTILITTNTVIDPGIVLQDRVQVTGLILANGQLEAERIKRLPSQDELPFEFVGVVQAMGSSSWTISGRVIALDEDTEIKGVIAVGDVVKVEGVITPENVWLAREIKLLEAEEPAFSLVGLLDSINPWVVAGVPFEVRPWTLIDPGLMVGELVRVNGRILADGTWVAYEITRLSGDDDALVIVFVGTVDSTNPWVVNGLPLAVNETSVIDPNITVGSLVRVTAEIRADGTWLIRELRLLEGTIEPGCVAITAVITNVSSGQITLSNGTTVPLDGVVVNGTLRVGSVVVIIACANDDGTITIISITVIYDPGEPVPPTPTPGPWPTPVPGGQNKVTICHKPGTPAQHTLTVAEPALSAHLGHGDTLGPCP